MQAGNVVKQLSGFVEDDALDLLQRMLAFAPQRRCAADEALLHTYVSLQSLKFHFSSIL